MAVRCLERIRFVGQAGWDIFITAANGSVWRFRFGPMEHGYDEVRPTLEGS